MHPLTSASSSDKSGSTQTLCEPNAMVFRIVRSGYNYFFDGETVVFLGFSEPPSFNDIGKLPEAGETINIFKEKEELRAVLADPHYDSFIIHPSETVRVISRFKL